MSITLECLNAIQDSIRNQAIDYDVVCAINNLCTVTAALAIELDNLRQQINAPKEASL